MRPFGLHKPSFRRSSKQSITSVLVTKSSESSEILHALTLEYMFTGGTTIISPK